MKGKYRILFQKDSKSQWICCIVLASLVILANVLLNLANLWFVETAVYVALSDSLMAIATGVLSAAILNLFYHRKENNRIRLIKSIPYSAMQPEYFEALERMNGKERSDDHTSVTFSQFVDANGTTHDEVFFLTMLCSYKTRINRRSITCGIQCVDQLSEDNKFEKSISGISYELNEYEFYWTNDETGSFRKDLVSDESYSIDDAFIDDIKLKIIKYYNSDAKVYSFVLSLPDNVSFDKTVIHKIQYRVKFPVKRAGMIVLTHDCPTQGTNIIIDYQQIKTKANVYTCAVTGAIEPTQSSNRLEGSESYSHSGWMLPKSGYVVAWWDNTK